MTRTPERRLSVLALLIALAGCAAPLGTPPTARAAAAAAASASVQASPATAVALVNPGFESSEPGILGGPQGWIGLQHAGPHSYDFTLDGAHARSGARSLRIDNVGPEVYGAIVQRVPAGAYRGKTLRYAVWMKTRGVAGGGLVDGTAPTLHAFRGGSPMPGADGAAAMLTGTHDWTRREVTLAIPGAADTVEIGVILGGPGTVWVDEAELAVVAQR